MNTLRYGLNGLVRAVAVSSILLLLTPNVNAAKKNTDAVSQHDFLRPYVLELDRETPPRTLDRITTMAESDLVLLHMGYGTWIRNKWLWGRRDPKLVDYFMSKGINHPDEMSGILIRELWEDLNAELNPEERAKIERKRQLVAEKRKAYLRLSEEGAQRLAASREAFNSCYARFGHPSKNRRNRDPFFKLIVSKEGRVDHIVFFEGASQEVKDCLQKEIEKYSFTPFDHDETLTLYITNFPWCRVQEIDYLYADDTAGKRN